LRLAKKKGVTRTPFKIQSNFDYDKEPVAGLGFEWIA
jgi:hypothetical protein